MLDLKYIRANAERVRWAIEQKGDQADLDRFLVLDEQRRGIQTQVGDLRASRNAASEEIGKLAKSGAPKEDLESRKAAVREVGEKTAVLEAELEKLEAEQEGISHWIPNIPPYAATASCCSSIPCSCRFA